MQIIFQDPFSSLNPRMTVGKILEEPIWSIKLSKINKREKRVHQLLEQVGYTLTWQIVILMSYLAAKDKELV